MAFAIGFDVSALDPSFKEHALRGIGRYVQELRRYFGSMAAGPVQIGEFDHRSVQRGLLDGLVNLLPAGRTTIRQQLLYPFRLRGGAMRRFGALHFPAHMDAPSWSPQRYILTVLDLIPLVCADLYKAGKPTWRFALARHLELKAIRNAGLVLAISKSTARDVERLLGIPPERIVVTPLGVDDRFFHPTTVPSRQAQLRGRLNIPEGRPIILYVGGIDQRKNWAMLLRTMGELGAHYGTQGRSKPVLVMAGLIERDAQFPKLRALIRQLSLDEDVRLPGYVCDDDLIGLYGLSSVFFFPSLYEGFGLPPLEALAAGVPVVSSNTSAMPEVLEGAAILISPHDVEQASREIIAIIDNSAHAARLRAGGPERARRYSWRRTGELTLGAYEQCAREWGACEQH